MQIGFYEEFPIKENLEKLKLIDFHSRVFIAAYSVNEFRELEKKARQLNKKIKYAFWPLVDNSYWISPFSNTKDLVGLFLELDKIKNHILIDLELPFLNKKLFFKNFFRFFKNKKLIRDFIEKNKRRITTAQYPLLNSKLIRFLGLDFNIDCEKNLMYYSSMGSYYLKEKIRKNLMKIQDKSNISIGLGTIDIGILGNEQILSPKNLEEDLKFVKSVGYDKIILFRLGGLNKEYLKKIKLFLK